MLAHRLRSLLSWLLDTFRTNMPSAKPPRRSLLAGSSSTTVPAPPGRGNGRKRGVPVEVDDDAYSEVASVAGGGRFTSGSRATSVRADGSTPGPSDNILAEQLSYLHLPLPFKSPKFTLYKARLPHPHPPVASSSTTTTYVPPPVLPGLSKTKKTAKQILAMEAYRGLSPEMLAEIKDRNEKKAKSKSAGGGISNLKGRQKAGAGSKAGGLLAQADAESLAGGSARSSIKGEDGSEDMDMEIDAEDAVVGSAGLRLKEDREAKDSKREVITYTTPQAPPSLLPLKKYCDITGLPARYTDPRTRLQYRGLEVWDVIRGLGPGVDQAYLAIRGAERRLV